MGVELQNCNGLGTCRAVLKRTEEFPYRISLSYIYNSLVFFFFCCSPFYLSDLVIPGLIQTLIMTQFSALMRESSDRGYYENERNVSTYLLSRYIGDAFTPFHFEIKTITDLCDDSFSSKQQSLHSRCHVLLCYR